ncbi:FCD domain-containing protein [Aurantimonas sp. MSK8Z-1]|uniref:FCD domain-containing protein n=1 Tax=Mangrovibrevibacter kandeliae TaxID=2968473 RepID=UPI002117B501|nr:FCD domain-containing protein [Aurantimonas sp. MSK8Z-1]MCW4113993.1 FCD domain-containing protein [Aurantimonas sp. MSK8Z-1]
MKEPEGVSAIDFLRTRSLANVVQAEIERMIIEGELKPNERVNENALSQRLGVSRGPIREACSALGAMGLIEIIPNRGFFIRALSNDEALDLSKARAAIFGSLAMMLAETVTDETIAMLRGLLEKMEAFADVGDVHEYYPINLEFHRQISQAAGNQRLASLYQSFVRELHIQRYRALSTGDTLHVSNKEHRALVDALEARDPLASLVAARGHILNGIKRTWEAGQPGDSVPAKAKIDPRSVGR